MRLVARVGRTLDSRRIQRPCQIPMSVQVLVTASLAPRVDDTARELTAKGEVLSTNREYIEIKGLPNPLPRSADGTYRIDLANSEVTMERMLTSLEALITTYATGGGGQGSQGLGILAPASPISKPFFANILESQARARAHVASIFSSELAVDGELARLAQEPVSALLRFSRTPGETAAFEGDRRLQSVAQRLNPSQKAAVARVIDARAQLTLIQGPPGTGKTTTAVAIICEWLLKYKGNILATAYSNTGVNNLMAGYIPCACPAHCPPFPCPASAPRERQRKAPLPRAAVPHPECWCLPRCCVLQWRPLRCCSSATALFIRN